ncbi:MULTISPECIES: DUF2795 domain-containing protein [unclassified Caballeronia]|uniref:DUF2795 domain-containing protein n=1 Tax=unclassified Caballeronia TaxID=2646786 RepID=UPI0028575C45|nr:MULTISPECIES: DUF2795 domain-containing protein [unclassified Caballeronia]MDR5739723.1 DUF2795 domain-containing protein [Caballeronia sp. LZ016]MDR5808188.1 DUF2795 domain-containing protein [Caballeronia sp. LZ019]
MSQHPAQSQDQRHEDEPRMDEIAQALKGAEYPLGKEKLIALAQRNGANGEVIALLHKMRDHKYDSDAAVLREASRAE